MTERVPRGPDEEAHATALDTGVPYALGGNIHESDKFIHDVKAYAESTGHRLYVMGGQGKNIRLVCRNWKKTT